MDLPRMDPEDVDIADALLADGSFSPEKEFQQILANTLDCDQSYAAQNGLRRKLVTREIGKPDFFKSAMIVDALIQPLEYAISYMMGHTKVLHDLWYLGKGHPKSTALLEKSRLKFMHVTSGKLADHVIQMYMTFLDTGLLCEINMGLQPTPTQLNTMFAMVVVCMSDVFRRFKFDFMQAPFNTFELLQCRTTQGFVHAFTILEAKFKKCTRCVDKGLTSALITGFPDVASKTHEQQESVRREVQSILNDLSGWTPTTSDMVELKNGQVQWSVSKRSGQTTKGVPAAMETTLIQSAIKQHQWVQEEEQKAARTITSQTTRETLEEKGARIQKATSRKIRTLSGWNVFQRLELENKSLSREAYADQIKTLSQRWRAMSPEEKEVYQVEALHQQSKIDELAQKPMPLGTDRSRSPIRDQEKSVWDNARSKISARRLLLNEEAFKSHGVWRLPTQCGDSGGALKARMIDTTSSDSQIEKSMSQTFHKPLDPHCFPDNDEDDAEDAFAFHQQPCFHFLCQNDQRHCDVQKLVATFAKEIDERKLQAGTLFMFSSDHCSDSFVGFLGVVLKKPRMHMFVEASISDGATEAAIKLDNGASPKFWSSHAVFLEFVNSEAAHSIAVEAWECQAFLQENCRLKSAPDRLKASFVMSTKPVDRKQNKKRSAKLPFGLKMPREKKSKKKRKQRSQPASASVQVQNMQIPSSSSETDPDSDIDVHPESEEDDDDHEIDPNQESERPVPVSAAVEVGFQEISQVAQEIESADVLKEEVAAVVRQDHAKRGSSFFAKEIGLAEGAIAVTGRSQCLHCKTHIPKGSVRFSWHYSTVRPPGWLHDYCLSSHIKQNNLQEKSKEFLTNLVASYKSGAASSASGFRRNPAAVESAEVAEVAMKVLSGLSAS
eukprot:Skav211224  [mRNA]  locus=scaffold934:287200:291877:- [translate_table: standard]